MLDRLHRAAAPGRRAGHRQRAVERRSGAGNVAAAGTLAADTAAIAAYNKRLPDDPRLFTTWLPVGDGVSISTKVQPT